MCVCVCLCVCVYSIHLGRVEVAALTLGVAAGVMVHGSDCGSKRVAGGRPCSA